MDFSVYSLRYAITTPPNADQQPSTTHPRPQTKAKVLYLFPSCSCLCSFIAAAVSSPCLTISASPNTSPKFFISSGAIRLLAPERVSTQSPPHPSSILSLPQCLKESRGRGQPTYPSDTADIPSPTSCIRDRSCLFAAVGSGGILL